MSATPEAPKREPSPQDDLRPSPRSNLERGGDPSLHAADYAALTSPSAEDIAPDPLASFAQLGASIPIMPPPQPPPIVAAPRPATIAAPPPPLAVPSADVPSFDDATANAPMLEDAPEIYRVTARTRSELRKQAAARLRGGAVDARPRSYGSRSDPTFGYLLGIALSVGLTPILPYNADLRLVVAWSVLAGIGVLAWLVGNSERIGEEAPENLIWGVVFGLILAAPLLLAGGNALTTTVQRLFRTGIDGELRALAPGTVLALVVFVMPLAETLFFRGLMQRGRAFWLVGGLGSLWSILLFFPMIEVGRYPAIAVIIGTTLTLMNMIYCYVRQRNGLAAAWLCQITINLLLFFVPYVTR